MEPVPGLEFSGGGRSAKAVAYDAQYSCCLLFSHKSRTCTHSMQSRYHFFVIMFRGELGGGGKLRG